MRRSLFLFLLLLTAANPARAAEPTDPRHRLQTEAGAAWGEFLQLASHVRGEVRGQTKNLKTGKIDGATEKVKFLVNGAAGLCETAEDRRRTIDLANERFRCLLMELSPGDWRLRQLFWNKPQDKLVRTGFTAARSDGDTIDSRPDKLSIAYVGRGLLIQATWLPAMFVSPSFKVVDVRGKQEAGNPLVRVEFEYQPENMRSNSLRNGWVELDPSRYWQIRRAEVQIDEPREGARGTIFVENEFDDATVGFPFAAKSVQRIRVASAGVSVERESVYLTRLEKIDREDKSPFQLPTYGIDEPARPSGEWIKSKGMNQN